MPTRNIVLTDQQSQLVERLVASGRYQNASEVLRDGLRLIERQEADDAARLEALREAARLGIADLEAGRSTLLETPQALREHLDRLADAALADNPDYDDT